MSTTTTHIGLTKPTLLEKFNLQAHFNDNWDKIDTAFASMTFYNVKDYGAIGDGVTNDTTAFKNCIEAANGKIIIVPNGVYNVKGVNTTCKSAYLIGIGYPTIKRTVAPTGDGDKFFFKFSGGIDSFTMSGILFDAQRDLWTQKATSVSAVDGTALSEEYDEWVDTSLVYLWGGGNNVEIKNCYFSNCSREAIYCQGNFKNVVIENNTFEHTSACFWSYRGTGTEGSVKNLVFKDNVIKDCRTLPLEIDTEGNCLSENLIIKNNIFDSIARSAVSLRNVKTVEFSGNTYIGATSLNEHGRSSRDTIDTIMVTMSSSNSTLDVSCTDVKILNNNSNGQGLVRSYYSSESKPIYQNIRIKDNVGTSINDTIHTISLSNVHNVDILNNVINGKKTCVLIQQNFDGINVKGNRINSDADGIAIANGTATIEENNIVTVGYPLLLSYNVNGVVTPQATVSLINNTADWSKMDSTHCMSTTNYSEAYGNHYSGTGIIDCVRKGNGMYKFPPMTDFARINYLTTDTWSYLTEVNTTVYYVGKTIHVLVNLDTANTGKTSITTASTTTGNIANVVTIADGDLLTLVWNGTKWIVK